MEPLTRSPIHYPSLRPLYDNYCTRPQQKELLHRWLAETLKSERTFRNRLDEPNLEDYVLFAKVLGRSLEELLGREPFPLSDPPGANALAAAYGLHKPD